MLDIKKAREKPQEIRQKLLTRSPQAVELFDRWLAADLQWRECTRKYEALLAEKNLIAKAIAHAKAKNSDISPLLKQGGVIAERLATAQSDAKAAEEQVHLLSLLVPNVPHETVPVGEDSSKNQIIAYGGKKPEFNFTPLGHVELLEKLGWVDFEKASKIAGSGFAVFRGLGAKLERALIFFLLDLHSSEHGYLEVSPPFLVNQASMVGTGQLPKFEQDMYCIADEDASRRFYLNPTAEVPLTNLYRDMLLKESELPIKLVGYTPCFRKEAGSAGRDTRGLIRMHQFDKVELVWITKPEDSYMALEQLRCHAEKVLQLLGLHYRTVLLCTGDLGFGAAKCYDIEVWAPGEGRYLEVSSCSNFEDFQARRLRLRYKSTEGKNITCHTLNGSGTALARLYVALVETYQQEDGTVKIPEVLKKYL